MPRTSTAVKREPSRSVRKRAAIKELPIARAFADQGTYGDIIRARTAFASGEAVFELTGTIVARPNKYTIQLDESRHVETHDSIWRFMNHSCAPNVRIDTGKPAMIAAREIEAGEELTFNYNSTEWSMTSSFLCGCGAPSCSGEIRGYRYLTPAQREAVAPLVSPFIARQAQASEPEPAKRAHGHVRALKPEVQLLIPYMVENGQRSSPEYDLPAFRAELAGWFEPLGLDWVWREVTIATIAETAAALRARATEHPIVVLNLCDGSEEDGYPGPTMVRTLLASGLPFSGAGIQFYEITTSKLATKRLLRASGVPAAPYVTIADPARDVARAVQEIGYPLFIKPDVSAGSYGIGIDSVCLDEASALRKAEKLRKDPYFHASAIYAEPFIEGREFTALVIEDPDSPLGLYVLPPGERVFDKRVPPGERFLAYERYWELPEEKRRIPEGEPYYWYASAPAELRGEIEMIARRAVRAVDGSGYARVDMRRSERTGEIFVLEVNAQCGLSSDDSSTVGSLLKLAGKTMPEIIELVLEHAMTRAGIMAAADA